jgi:hypothetical protein
MRLTLSRVSLQRLELHQPSDPPERSRSCSGRIEASSAYQESHTRKPLSLHINCPNVSQSNRSPEPVSDCHPRRSRYQEILEFSLLERIDRSAKEEKNKNPLDEKHKLVYLRGEPEIVTKRKNDDEKATFLPSIVLAQKATKTCTSTVPLCAVIKKRRFEKGDEDIPSTLNFKKPRGGRTKQSKSPAGYQSIVESLRIEKSDPTFKPSPYDFQASSQ